MRYSLRRPQDSGELVRRRGGWRKYHLWLEQQGLLKFVNGVPLFLQTPVRKDKKKVGRNKPCSCGSGKKYKKCCWRRG